MNAAIPSEQRSRLQSQKIITILAFASVCIMWGFTYCAVRVAVQTVPPFLAAGLRFLVAGSILFAYLLIRGRPLPSALKWQNLAISALLLLSAEAGEMRPLPVISAEAWRAILYLTIAGSVVAFSAYVNPVVALALGYSFGKESTDFSPVCRNVSDARGK